jgi:uncharacterized protein (DUF488 family)
VWRAKGGIETKRLPKSVKGIIYTVGHSTRMQEEFLAVLEANDIQLLVDVRTIPRSRHNPQFNSEILAKYLRQHKIGYKHLAALGGLRHTHKNSVNMGWRNTSFRGFADYMQTPEFEDGLETLISLAQEKRTAIMCAESVPWRCHRSLIADALTVKGFHVMDIMSATSIKEHKLNPIAVVCGDKITYPSDDRALQV